MTRDISERIDGIQPMSWGALYNPKDMPELDLRKPVGLDLDINPKDTSKGAGYYYGHEVISIDPKMSFEGLRLPYDTSPKGIMEINTDLQQQAERKRKRDQQDEYERFYLSTSIESLDPKKAKQSAVAVEKKAPAAVSLDTTPDVQPKSPKPLAVEEGLQPIHKESPIKSKGLSVGGIFNWVAGLFKPGSKSDAAEATAPGKAENVINSVPKLTPPEQANLEKVLKLIEQMNEDLKRIREIEKEDNTSETNPNNAEAYYLSLLVARVRDQVRIKETQMLADNDRIKQSQQEIKEAQAKFFDIQKAIAERAKTSGILGWIDFGSTVTIIGLAGVSGGLFVASFFTAGATLPIAIATAQSVIGAGAAVAGIAGGGAKIGKAVLDQKTKEQTAEATGIRHKREKAQEEIKMGMRDWEDSMKAVGKSWEDISSVFKGRQRAITDIMN